MSAAAPTTSSALVRSSRNRFGFLSARVARKQHSTLTLRVPGAVTKRDRAGLALAFTTRSQHHLLFMRVYI